MTIRAALLNYIDNRAKHENPFDTSGLQMARNVRMALYPQMVMDGSILRLLRMLSDDSEIVYHNTNRANSQYKIKRLEKVAYREVEGGQLEMVI